jgi:glucosamine-6-phosphate deaminase
MQRRVTARVVRSYGQLQVYVFSDGADLAAKAAEDLASIIAGSVGKRGLASIIVATGNSQLQFMAALRQRSDIEWGKVVVLHMDEYLGMSERHPASFRRYIRHNLTDWVHPRDFFGIRGDARDVEAELRRYADLLRQYSPDGCVMGIGENGHLAFNDPPADFGTDAVIRVAELDAACRQQQVGEGHFAGVDRVPRRAITLTVPALLAASHLLIVAPELRKAAAVKAALEGPVAPACPASILRRQPHARLYLDSGSSSLLDGV